MFVSFTSLIMLMYFPSIPELFFFNNYYYYERTLNFHTVNEQHKEEIKGAFPLTIALIKIKYLDKFKQGGRALKQGKL